MTDKERMDFLESLCCRTEFQNGRVGMVPIGSDMHFTRDSASLYMRDLLGNVNFSGSGKTVREAIDAAMGPQA